MEQEKKEDFKQEGIRKWFRKENLIVLVLGGILLFVIALPVESDKREAETKASGNQSSLLTLDALDGRDVGEENDRISATQTGSTDQEYALYLEEKLCNALAKVADVGQVEVMITLQSSRELVVEKVHA